VEKDLIELVGERGLGGGRGIFLLEFYEDVLV
jgi:hypothetical protein